jgi:hypothetical protein
MTTQGWREDEVSRTLALAAGRRESGQPQNLKASWSLDARIAEAIDSAGKDEQRILRVKMCDRKRIKHQTRSRSNIATTTTW